MPQTVITTLNDVDLDSVARLAEKIQETPEVAATKWNAEVKWKGGFRSEAKIRDFASAKSDELANLEERIPDPIRSSRFLARWEIVWPSATPLTPRPQV